MKPTLNLLVFLLVTSVLVGCGNKNKRPDSELVTDKDPVRSMLSLIPADTPYAFVALEPMPVAPMLEWTKNYTGAISDILPNYSDMLQDEYLDPSVKLFYAVLSEFDGRFDAEGLQELGFSLSPRFAIYGVGALPAMRLDLGDAEKFAQFVARVETKAGLERVDEKLGDTDFWSYTTNSNVTVMAIQDKQLVVGWAPPDAAPVTTPYLLGEKLPEKSMADTTVLQDLADKHGFKRFGVGFIDLRRWMQMFITPEPGLNDDTLRAMGADFPDPSEACKSETLAIVDAAPRLVAGYEGWSIEEARFAAGIELEDDFGAQLAATREPAPAVGTDFARSAPIMAAFGVHVGKLIDILNERALRVRNNPYQCQWYRELNQVANEVTTAAAAIPALVRNLRGAAVIVSNATMERNPPAPPPAQPAQPGGPTTQPSQPQASTGAGMTPTMPQWKVHGLAMVTSADAISLFNLARSFVPELMSFNAPTNGSPTALPEIDGVDFLLSPHVALTTDTLMVTSGDTATNSANSVLEANAPTTTPFMTVVYNLKALADVIADSGAPVPPEVRSLLTGRTELQVEPRDNGVFVRTSLQLTPR